MVVANPGETQTASGIITATNEKGLLASGGTINGDDTLDLTVTSTPTFAFGGSVTDGGTITLSGGKITTAGPTAFALDVDGAGSTLNANGTTLTTTDSNSHGVYVEDGGVAKVLNLTIDTSGEFSNGIDNAGGTATVTNAAVTIHGDSSYGIDAQNAGSTETVTGGTVTNSGTRDGGFGAGVGSLNGATLSVQGTSIQTSNNTPGAESSAAQLQLTGVSITTQGDDGYGVLVQNAGQAVLAGGASDTQIHTGGVYAWGLFATGAGSSISGSAQISTSGAGANGIAVQDGAAVNLTDSDVKTNDLTGHGIFASAGSTAGAVNTVTLQGGTLNAGGDLVHSEGAGLNVTLTGLSQASNGSGLVLNASSSANVMLLADGVTLSGDIVTDSTSTANVTLNNASMLTGKADSAALAIDGTSSWNVTGDSVLTNLSNAGNIVFLPSTGTFKTVTTGSFTGTNGTISLNTVLGADNSPGDKLVINGGTATGATKLAIANAGGNGAKTTADGILVVGVLNNATTAAGAFSLSKPLEAGAYQYFLYRGGSANANDWFLRSTFEAPSEPVTPASPDAPPTPSGTVQPTGTPASAPVAYRPAVAGYTLVPLLNMDYGFTVLGNLHERVGDVENAEASRQGTQGIANKDGVWGRMSEQELDVDSNHRFSADERTFFAQFGKDWTLARGAAGQGSTHAGVTLTLGSSSATFKDSLRSLVPELSTSVGSVETQAQSLGGYWTRYFADGGYVDGVAQLTHYHNRYSDGYNGGASQDGYGTGASVEVGKPFLLGSTTLAIEPQAQLLYQYLHLGDFDDSISSVSGNATNALRGRLGFRLLRANLENDTKTGSLTPYLTANVLHDFLAPSQTVVGTTSLTTAPSKTWYELGLGATASMGKGSELYVSAKYARNFDGEYHRNVFGEVGYRYSW